jgi:uncharacterized phage protein (TIGR02218 family)
VIDLNVPELALRELYYFRLVNGRELYLTSGAEVIAFQGNDYQPCMIKRGSIKHTADITVPSVDITFAVNALNIDGRNVERMVTDGYFDAAQIAIILYDKLQTAYQYLFRGEVVDTSESTLFEVTVRAKNILRYLENTMPRTVFQKKCNHTLFDHFCRLSRADYVQAGVLYAAFTGGSGNQYTLMTSVQYGTGLYTGGMITMTSGAATGETRLIITDEYGFALNKPFWVSPAFGDTFEMTPGCDKTSDCCKSRFNNLDNFLGFEFIPEADTVLKV